jgi:hypothetical protein
MRNLNEKINNETLLLKEFYLADIQNALHDNITFDAVACDYKLSIILKIW